MASSQLLDSRSIIAAIASPATCTASTLAALQQFLLPRDGSKATNDGKENCKIRTTRRPGTLAVSAKATILPKGRTPRKLAGTVIAQTEATPDLSPREKLNLAFEVVNTALKSLSRSLKEKSDEPAKSKPLAKQEAIHSPPSKSRRALKSRSPNAREATVSIDETIAQSVGPGSLATAECARVALAHIRGHGGPDGNPESEYQVENAMLALVGKCITHDLDILAVKELRILKRRLVANIGRGGDRLDNGDQPRPARGGDQEKETIADLLRFGDVAPDSPFAPLIVAHQLHVVKLLVKMRKPRTTEAALKYLDMAYTSSPANLLLHQACNSDLRNKTARQLEILAQSLLSMCPSVATADDPLAIDVRVSVCPEAVFQLQSLAFRVRISWWCLAAHKPDVEKELWTPFWKSLATFTRRATIEASRKYEIAASVVREIESGLEICLRSIKVTLAPVRASSLLPAIYRVLSQLAQAAKLTHEAMGWTSALPATNDSSSSNDATSAGCTIRLAAIGLMSKDGEELLRQALASLSGSLKGDGPALDSLLLEVAGLRRSTFKLLSEELKGRENARLSNLNRLCCEAIFASNRFLVRYIGASPSPDADEIIASRHREKLAMAQKVLKAFTESAFWCCKRCIPVSTFPIDTIDSALQDCSILVKTLQGSEDPNEEQAYQFHQELQLPFVKISNNYFNLYLQQSKADGMKSSSALLILRRSIDVLRGRTAMEKGSGLFAVKLERLSNLFYDAGELDDAYLFIEETLQEHMTAGLLRSAAEEAATSSLQCLCSGKGPTSILNRALRRSNQILLKAKRTNEAETEVLDDENLPLEERGLLLELQLQITSQDVIGRHADDVALSRIGYLIHTLLSIYSAEDFPIRRLRVAVMASRIVSQHSSLLHDDLDCILEECTHETESLGRDDGLSSYLQHLQAHLRVTLALRDLPVAMDALQESLNTWKTLLDAIIPSSDLSSCIDDIPVWIACLSLISDFFEMQGVPHQAIVVLSLVTRATEMLPTPGIPNLVNSLIRMGMNYLALGYSGKAGLSLEKARQYLNQDGVNAEIVLKWHIAHAEYLFSIGNIEKCRETLVKSEAVAADAQEMLQISGPGGTLSSRIRAKRLLADAAYAYSLYNMEVGNMEAAFDCARTCVKLNQSVWTTIENRKSPSQAKSTPAGTDTEVDTLTKSMNGLSTSMFATRPPIVSTTHASLSGSEFWSLVPALMRGLNHLSTIYLHYGFFMEATHNAQLAKKIADAVMSPSELVNSASILAGLYVRSGRIEKAQERFDEAAAVIKDLGQTKEMVLYNSVAATIWRAREEVEEEVESWDGAIHTIEQLFADASNWKLNPIETAEDQLVDQLATLQLEMEVKPKRMTKARGPVGKPPTQARQTKAAKALTTVVDLAEECTPLIALRGTIIREKAATLLQEGDNSTATVLFKEAEQYQVSQAGRIEQATIKFRLLLSEASKQMVSNLTFSALPESTIALPALARSDRGSSHQVDNVDAVTIAPHRKATTKSTRKPAAKKSVAAKAPKGCDFAITLQSARDCLNDFHPLSLRISSIEKFRELSELLGAASILLSATEHIQPKGLVHPLSTAFYLDLPSIHASSLEKSVLRTENAVISKDKILQWPSLPHSPSEQTSLPSAIQFKRDYIDILPEAWTVVSMSLDNAKGELLLTRYRCDQSPLILRLPMARHKSRDLDEDVFDFTAGKQEIQEIAELANFSAHDARDMSKKGAKTQWWAEREALDLRLKELLLNIENIWLGGFRGIFAQGRCDPQALANFQSELLKILGRHLPSRQGKMQPKVIKPDPRILELFTGLGDPEVEGMDLDEPLMDLLYFVVDILQFNGERNAYDEIDFDAIVIEVIDALKSYHSSADPDREEDHHTILILDKCLHGFPWESLPSLRGQSVSRLPSLAALRSRAVMMENSRSGLNEMQNGAYYVSRSSGTSILNPSGDLKNTQETMEPLLNSLPSSWTHSCSAQDERGFSSLLSDNEILLYFGHGSGSHYIRPRAVKKLAVASPSPASGSTCATTWLMGCSSAAVTENGVFEPEGMALAYLTAGAPAVVGTLWDVTDKDCDRASVKAGELWGLWDIPSESSSSSKSGKGKQKQKDVEKPRGGTVAAKRKLFEDNKTADIRMKRGVSPERVKRKMGLSEAVAKGRETCYLKYLNGAALVTYGIPVYLKE